MITLLIALAIVIVLFFVAIVVMGARIGGNFNSDIFRDDYLDDLYGVDFTKEERENDENTNKTN